jgi:ureidoglycolate amidohydrolase
MVLIRLAPVVGTGSHIDAIPNAGKYDGVVGVLGGLEAIRALQRGGFRPRHSIELLIFTAEEPTRFGIGCLGSRLLSGALAPDAARQLTDKDGNTLDKVRRGAGFAGELEQVSYRPDTTRRSSNCTSNKVRCWSVNKFLWESLQT